MPQTEVPILCSMVAMQCHAADNRQSAAEAARVGMDEGQGRKQKRFPIKCEFDKVCGITCVGDSIYSVMVDVILICVLQCFIS